MGTSEGFRRIACVHTCEFMLANYSRVFLFTVEDSPIGVAVVPSTLTFMPGNPIMQVMALGDSIIVWTL